MSRLPMKSGYRELCEKALDTGADIGSLIVLCDVLYVYGILRGGLTSEDLKLVTKAVLGHELSPSPKPKQVSLNGIVRDLVEQDLRQLNLSYGDRFTRKIIYESPDREAAIKSFLRLKRLGFIVESRSGLHKVVGKDEASSLIREIEESGKSLNDIMMNARVGWSEDDILMEAETSLQRDLSSINEKRLLKMLHARVNRGDVKGSRRILKELVNRVGKLSSREVSMLAREIVRNPSIASEEDIKTLVERKPSLLSKFSKRGLKPGFSPRQSSGASRGGYSRSLGGSEASSIYLKKYAETGNPGYLDMWLSNLAIEGDSYNIAKQVAEKLESRSYGGLNPAVISKLYRIAPEDAVVVVSLLLKEPSPYKLKKSLARIVFSKTKYGRQSGLSKTVTTVKMGGRIDTRLSIYRITRLSSMPFVYRVRTKKPGAVLVVDTSGSLRNYSSEVILYSSMLKHLLEALIVFSDKAVAFRCTRKNCDPSMLLGKISFSGNTNIVNALEKASAFRVKKVIVITDLKHNASGVDDLAKTTRELLLKGRRIVYVVVGDYDRRVLSLLDGSGAKLVLADNYRKVLKVLYREMVSR